MPARPKPVYITNKLWPSFTEAARHYGVNVSVVSVHYHAGTLDRLGTGTTKRQPCVVDGVEYPSRNAACSALGVNQEKLNRMIGATPQPRFRPPQLPAVRSKGAVPVRVHGWLFPSMKAAARALGITPQTMSHHLDAGTLDRAGLGRGANRRVKITVDGIDYESYSEAARLLGVPLTTLRKRIIRCKSTTNTRHPRKDPITPSCGC